MIFPRKKFGKLEIKIRVSSAGAKGFRGLYTGLVDWASILHVTVRVKID